MIRITVIIAFSLIFLGGCTFTPLAKPSPEAESPETSVMLAEAEQTPPLVVPEKSEPPAERDYRQLDGEYEPGISSVPQRQQRGFRVQVITTKDPAQADDIIDEIETKLDLPVYKIFEPPYYKVRVGNCVEQTEAEELMDELRREGYETFIVRDLVNPADNEQ